MQICTLREHPVKDCGVWEDTGIKSRNIMLCKAGLNVFRYIFVYRRAQCKIEIYKVVYRRAQA